MDLNNKEYIGFLLWQEDERDEILKLVEKYCDTSNILDIKLAIEIPISSKKIKNQIIRSIYEDEIIPDDNPKIVSNSKIFMIIIQDIIPKYDLVKTGSGKNLNANVNGIDLKRHIREKYHWKYIHCTDNQKDFSKLILLLKSFCKDEDFNNLINSFISYKRVKIDIDNIYFSFQGDLINIIDSPHFDYVNSIFNKTKFFSKKYYEYNHKFLSDYGTIYGRSSKRFDGLIKKFDYKNYNKSEDYRLLNGNGFSLSENKYKNFVKGAALSSFLKERTKITTSKLLLDYYLNFKNKKISSEIFFILDDGLHRASILKYFNIEKVEVLVYPVNYNLNILCSTLQNVPYTNYDIGEDYQPKKVSCMEFHKNWAGVFI